MAETRTSESLRRRLLACPPGVAGWKEFEDIGIVILEFLLCPPLTRPIIQPRTCSGIDRRDAVFPNRNHGANNYWGHLLGELDARMILVEFKNYGKEEIGKEEVNQTRNYLNAPMGRLALMVVNKKPDEAAHIKRNTIFTQDRKVILFVTAEHLIEMLYMRDRGEDPVDLIMDLLERFYLQHE